ncbi:imidazoleglycerol-phosphate dehydratase [Candidatus Bathyarchaeota archaeon]|nr:imidazoleglycerol-phosphate dehydratase [Candidatus Bathyarchaeota archaeon]
MMDRIADLDRNTGETTVKVRVNLDGKGFFELDTQVPFMTHLLQMLAKHGKIDVMVNAHGDLDHHVIEDTAMVLGKAIQKALAEKRGIYRFGQHYVAMDEALARCVIDVSGRSCHVCDLGLKGLDIEGMKVEDIEHFLISFTKNLKANVHLHVFYGENDHHRVEAAFKALALALRMAITRDPRAPETVPSTKGMLEQN